MAHSRVDLLIIGGGMAGLAAAARTLQRGGTAIVVEKGGTVGGSAQYAEFIWTAPTLDVMRRVNPGGDPALSMTLVDDYPNAIEWVRALGVEVRPAVDLLGFGRGHGTDLATLFRIAVRMLREDPGSDILLRAEPIRLIMTGGRVAGAEVRLESGEHPTILARSTLLATGGFGGNPDLRQRHLGEQARDIPLRANPYSTGRGLELGLSAGARFGKVDAGFYGHLMASGVNVTDPLMFAPMTFYHSEHGILLNVRGERFIDETVGDQLNAIALLDQPDARCLLIYDERVHRGWMLKPYVEGVEPYDKFAAAYKGGGRCAVAHNLDEFQALPPEWGYAAEAVHAALLEFNHQAASGAHDPPRARDALPLGEPPFYVVEVVPAITFTFGGLLIDADARVLDEDGEPIPGLLAAGADAGGLYDRAYAGGLAAALVFGLRASDTALTASGRATASQVASAGG
jgi:succinate dehydrogenase/fumarate reductase flavoprotein subunit